MLGSEHAGVVRILTTIQWACRGSSQDCKKNSDGQHRPRGTLNTDKVSVALLQYHNTPLREINKSPAQLATGRQLRDGVPADKQHYKVNKNWCRTLHERELKLAKRHRKREIDRGIHRTLS